MTRYYRNPRNDYVYTWGDDDPAPDGCPEVRIVPADAIVIERDELSEVEDDGETLRAGRGGHVVTYRGRDVPVPRAYALGWLALAEHVKANPPVNEAAVEALADAISKFAPGNPVLTRNLARALIRAGWTKGGAA